MGKKTNRPNGWPKPGKNIVVYPRKYRIDPNDDSNSYVEGVGSKGDNFRMYLKLSPFYKKSLSQSNEKKVPPRLCDYARTGRSAPKSCIASEDNGPHQNREGVLLFSRVFPIKGTPNFSAGWCVILARDRMDPDPVFGIGRMEFDFGNSRFDTEETQSAKRLVRNLRTKLLKLDKEHEDYLSTEYELEQAEEALREIRPVRFKGVVDALNDIRTVKPQGMPISLDKTKSEILDVLGKYTTSDGRYGGCLLRTISEDGTVSVKKCAKLTLRYIKEKESAMTPPEALSEFMKFGAKRVLSGSAKNDTVQIMPFQQINCGPLGNSEYKKSGPFRTLSRVYLNKEQTLSCNCRIAIRCIEAPSNGNLLLGSIYATSSPIGNVLSLNEDAKPVYSVVL